MMIRLVGYTNAGPPLTKAVDNQQRCANGDRAIGDIERGKWVEPPTAWRPKRQVVVDEDEINDPADKSPV